MLGLTRNGNTWVFILGNFLIQFGAQIAFELYELLPQGAMPTEYQLYSAGIKALIGTLAIYGLNKATHKEPE